MENNELMALWKSYDQKLEENLTLNRRNADDILRIKIRSLIGSMKPIKIFTILTGILWVAFVDVIIMNTFQFASVFFLISAGIQVVLTKLAIGIYLYQMILIHQTDITKPLFDTQERIARLQASTIWVTRVLFLQFPVWTTFYISESLLQNGGIIWYFIQGITTIAFTIFAIWLFANIKFENRHKNWFRVIFSGKEWEPVMKASEMLRQIESYK